MQIIPLTSEPNQSFQATVTVDGLNRALQFNIRFSEVAGYWIMKITDPATATILLDSIPMLAGLNILEQYAYLGIGSAYIINASGSSDDYPTENNLGTDFVLGWDDTPNV